MDFNLLDAGGALVFHGAGPAHNLSLRKESAPGRFPASCPASGAHLRLQTLQQFDQFPGGRRERAVALEDDAEGTQKSLVRELDL